MKHKNKLRNLVLFIFFLIYSYQLFLRTSFLYQNEITYALLILIGLGIPLCLNFFLLDFFFTRLSQKNGNTKLDVLVILSWQICLTFFLVWNNQYFLSTLSLFLYPFLKKQIVLQYILYVGIFLVALFFISFLYLELIIHLIMNVQKYFT